MGRLRCRVVWQEEDPDLTELLGPSPWRGGMWYILGPTDVNVPLHMSGMMLHLPCPKRFSQTTVSWFCLW